MGFPCGGLETGFLRKSGWGFGDCRRNPVSGIFGILGGELETGFLPESGWGFGDYRRNPVSGIFGILGGELETGFLTKISVMMRKFW